MYPHFTDKAAELPPGEVTCQESPAVRMIRGLTPGPLRSGGHEGSQERPTLSPWSLETPVPSDRDEEDTARKSE